MKKLLITALVAAFGASAASAGLSFDDGRAFDLNAAIAAAEVSEAPAADKAARSKEWTIMVFINAKNNLERFGLKDVNEMEQIGSTDKVNVVVELARIAGFDSSDGDWKTSRRYLVQKDSDPARVTSPVVEELPSVDMGDWKHLVEFGKWAKAKYPAKRYMLIVWNHGAGWIKTVPGPVTKGISYDDETKNHITTPQLGMALKEMGGVNVYGSDACLMQMGEVVYELKDYADYIVGSEETEPGDGYTYDLLLGPLAANPAMPPMEMAKLAVDAYSDHYQQLKQGSTQSFVKSSAILAFTSAVNEFVDAVMASGDKAGVAAAKDAAQSYAYPENKDLVHFVELLLASNTDAAVQARGQALISLVTKKLVGHNRTNNSPGSWWSGPVDYSKSRGIAVYLPPSAAPAHYNELAWAGASKWDEFINWYLGR